MLLDSFSKQINFELKKPYGIKMRKSSKFSFAEFRMREARPCFKIEIFLTLFNSMYEIDFTNFPDRILKNYNFYCR